MSIVIPYGIVGVLTQDPTSQGLPQTLVTSTNPRHTKRVLLVARIVTIRLKDIS
jgi:hypothetical protein